MVQATSPYSSRRTGPTPIPVKSPCALLATGGFTRRYSSSAPEGKELGTCGGGSSRAGWKTKRAAMLASCFAFCALRDLTFADGDLVVPVSRVASGTGSVSTIIAEVVWSLILSCSSISASFCFAISSRVSFSFASRSSFEPATLPQPSPPAFFASASTCFKYMFLYLRPGSTMGPLIFSNDPRISATSVLPIFSFLSILT
mmetsp:Transcript_52321/g.117825  ORF Transcript_52321/g.117825 Transcript_52321/m.117825 type:complete len:201 (-) Transcript_52321:394-996(-)